MYGRDRANNVVGVEDSAQTLCFLKRAPGPGGRVWSICALAEKLSEVISMCIVYTTILTVHVYTLLTVQCCPKLLSAAAKLDSQILSFILVVVMIIITIPSI